MRGKCTSCGLRSGHPECTVCPNFLAASDRAFDLERAKAGKWKCGYNHLWCGKPCRGVGHQARRHLHCLTEEAEQSLKDHGVPVFSEAKGPGGETGRGQGGTRGPRRLDLNAEVKTRQLRSQEHGQTRC